MRYVNMALVAFLGLATVVTAGCQKKNEEANLATNTGFDSLQTEELAQLLQVNNSSQQAAVEVLPIETSPVTQSVPTAASIPAAAPAAGETLTYAQKIQTALKNAGLYTGNIDGKIGPNTRKAIEQFQKDHNLKVDGKVGPKTWAALEPYYTGQAATGEAQPVVQ